MKKDLLKIHQADNVAIALRKLNTGDVVDLDGQAIPIQEEINRGHKVAVQDIKQGENVLKYGFPIGHALQDISAGDHVHTHNLKTNLEGISEYSYEPQDFQLKDFQRNLNFLGYRREDGRVGIRNELWIVPTVGCVNGTAEQIIERFKEEVKNTAIDNIMVLKHNYGCSQLGDDHLNTRTILGDVVKHPNAGGVLILGLGCENNTMTEFIKSLGDYNQQRIKYLVSQEVSDEVAEGVNILKRLYEQMVKDQREEIPLSELKVGLKCGASDGFSGITANPLLGKFTDFLVAQGGTAVLTEVPEMFGAETLLMARAKDKEVFAKTVDLINNFKEYFIEYKQPVYENPSPGNKAGGITTLEDKSLGCTQKAGSATVMDVLKYGDTLQTKGLNLLSAPGNDLVASSALAAAGCQLVLFTTGRGTPFGSFVPTMKISSNSQIYELKPHWIDFNAGSLIEDVTLDNLLEDFINYILAVASGRWVNNENNQFRELAIFKKGVTL
ncbi:altronate dehydratase [Desulfosporosinus acididurans]|uniref:Altronate dehydratase n=1 Tax=Desulfosporosinus acididurans TaxID=476652 RepID=A0A0J1FQP1_9FIRM|nr:altronate dehydratase family protein [Desulfosporosinus acididurans]KLU65602.1 altronate dehydratase [Desulfosporosinus acididurans]